MAIPGKSPVKMKSQIFYFIHPRDDGLVEGEVWTVVWLKVRCGQLPRRKEKVTCWDFSFILIFHLQVHFSMLRRWVCKFAEAVTGFE